MMKEERMKETVYVSCHVVTVLLTTNKNGQQKHKGIILIINVAINKQIHFINQHEPSSFALLLWNLRRCQCERQAFQVRLLQVK